MASVLRVCLVPGCSQTTSTGRCAEHQQGRRHHQRRFDTGPTAYGTKRWRLLSERFRVEHPFCVNPDRYAGCTVVTEVTDHIVPHRGDETLMFDEANLQPLCRACHNRKTAREVGWGGDPNV